MRHLNRQGYETQDRTNFINRSVEPLDTGHILTPLSSGFENVVSRKLGWTYAVHLPATQNDRVVERSRTLALLEYTIVYVACRLTNLDREWARLVDQCRERESVNPPFELGGIFLGVVKSGIFQLDVRNVLCRSGTVDAATHSHKSL